MVKMNFNDLRLLSFPYNCIDFVYFVYKTYSKSFYCQLSKISIKILQYCLKYNAKKQLKNKFCSP